MNWNWNWNGPWCAGVMSLGLMAFGTPLGYRVALIPICILLFGLHRRQTDADDR